MATRADVRRIALSLADTVEATDRFAFSVMVKEKEKGFAWVWLERVDPKKARVPNPAVLAIRTGSVAERDTMIACDPEKFFTEPHYANYPAVLVRLAAVNARELRTLLESGRECVMPKPRKARRTSP